MLYTRTASDVAINFDPAETDTASLDSGLLGIRHLSPAAGQPLRGIAVPTQMQILSRTYCVGLSFSQPPPSCDPRRAVTPSFAFTPVRVRILPLGTWIGTARSGLANRVMGKQQMPWRGHRVLPREKSRNVRSGGVPQPPSYLSGVEIRCNNIGRDRSREVDTVLVML